MNKGTLSILCASMLFTASAVADLPYSSLSFPRDAAGHLDNTGYDNLNIFEYWYYTGKLQAANGEKLSYSYAVFAAEFPQPDGSVQPAHWAHMTVIDQDKRILYAGKDVFDSTNITFSNSSLDLNYNDKYVLKGYESGVEYLSSKAYDVDADKALALSLYFQPTQGKMITNGNGVLDMPDGGNSFHYSQARMLTTGSVKIGDKTYTVNPANSESWTSHQWGDFFPVEHGWDWFSVSLDNGIDAQFYLHADKIRNIVGGTVSLKMPDGSHKTIAVEDISYERSNYWTSPRYGQTYPLSYAIIIPEIDLHLELNARFAEQTVDGMLDGMVDVKAIYQNEAVSGYGFTNINIME